METVSSTSATSPHVRLTTLLRFVIGGRNAIIDIASCPGAIWLGALLVLSAGFAREYDGADLLHEPWHLVAPLGASLATSFVLHCLLYWATRQNAETPPRFIPSYRRFLSLYWMTAPLAWLYAVPVEHFMSEADAVKTNLSLLGIVSLWRVLLITRCSAVVFGSSFIAAFLLVMFFADTLALVILYFTPVPIFNVMGGIRLTASEYIIRDTALFAKVIGGATWLIWFAASCVILLSVKRNWIPTQFDTLRVARISKPVWAVAILALAIWPAVLPYTQPPQRLRWLVESDLQDGRADEAIGIMSAHERGDFPPHWDPPPWPAYGEDTLPLIDLLEAVTNDLSADWVLDLYLTKVSVQIEDSYSAYRYWNGMNDNEFDRYVAILDKLPKSHNFVHLNFRTAQQAAVYASDSDVESQDRMQRIVAAARSDAPEMKNPPEQAEGP